MIEEDYIKQMAARIPALEQEMATPEVAGNHRKLREYTREYGRLRSIVDKGERYLKIKYDLEENKALLSDPEVDPELKELAEAEITELEEMMQTSEQDVMVALLPADPNDARNVIVEIRAGTGGEEAALFAADLFRMYSHFAETQGFKIGMIDASAASQGGYKEVVFSIEGTDVFKLFKYEGGGHRVQRVPVTESQGRIHTSAATVAVLPEADESQDDIQIAPEDLRIDLYCSSGPGGQSVNTTQSAVRITHLPTGIIAQCQDEKSQHRNKAQAMMVIKARVLDAQRRAEAEKMASEKKAMIGSGDRSQRVRTYNFPQNRVTDHRIGYTAHNLDRLIEGDMQELIKALTDHDLAERIEEAFASSALEAEGAQ